MTSHTNTATSATINTTTSATISETTNGWAGTVKGMPALGASASRSKTMSAQDIALFAQISGDYNPLHFDQACARASTFGGLIVHGGVSTSLLNALVAEDLPGPGTVFLNLTLDFPKAVYLGDTATAHLEIQSVRTDKPVCKVAVSIKNQHGELCVSGSATTYTVALTRSTS